MKKAGFPQDGCDGYWTNAELWEGETSTGYVSRIIKGKEFKLDVSPICDSYAAPCVGRLGNELPEYVDIPAFTLGIFIYKNNKEWAVAYDDCEGTEHICMTNTLFANCLALMYIELKKRGLINIEREVMND